MKYILDFVFIAFAFVAGVYYDHYFRAPDTKYIYSKYPAEVYNVQPAIDQLNAQKNKDPQ